MNIHHALVTLSLLASPVIDASPVNINTANAQMLATSLKGIGLFKGKAIVRYRSLHGKFHQARDITSVKGIGLATFKKNRQDILTD